MLEQVRDQHVCASVAGREQYGLTDGACTDDDDPLRVGDLRADRRLQPDGHRLDEGGEIGLEVPDGMQRLRPHRDLLLQGAVEVHAEHPEVDAAVGPAAPARVAPTARF